MEVFKYNKERITRINQFMKKLVELSSSSDKVKLYKEYENDILSINPLDIFYLDFYSNNTALSIAEIKESANRFVNVFHKGLSPYSNFGDIILFKELLNESKRMEEQLAKIKPYYKREVIATKRHELLKVFKECQVFDLKFQKFQNIIFPNLEEVLPSTKPLEVLWELHDDSRDLLKKIIILLESDEATEEELIKQIGTYHYLIFGINQKEELILLPVMKQLLTEKKLQEIYNECLEIGFVFSNDQLNPIEINKNDNLSGYFSSKTGKMSIAQLIAMLNHLPFDITFVDKDDVVLYYNESKNRHFPRTPSVVGRLVKNCHPPKSVHIVEGIIADFKSKKKDFEEFWINFKGQTLYIAYYAVRDEHDEYLGVIEVSQNISKFQEISGEKRLRDSE